MDKIDYLVKERFTIFNVNDKKYPSINGWQTISFNDVLHLCTFKTPN